MIKIIKQKLCSFFWKKLLIICSKAQIIKWTFPRHCLCKFLPVRDLLFRKQQSQDRIQKAAVTRISLALASMSFHAIFYA